MKVDFVLNTCGDSLWSNKIKPVSITNIYDYADFDFPNVITPNGDGINDRFVIKNLDQYPNNKLQVFDRTGKILYETNPSTSY